MNYLHLLTVALIVLKLLKLVAISWLLVFAPSIICVAVGLLLILFVVLAAVFG